jgi:hypothetical protein
MWNLFLIFHRQSFLSCSLCAEFPCLTSIKVHVHDVRADPDWPVNVGIGMEWVGVGVGGGGAII